MSNHKERQSLKTTHVVICVTKKKKLNWILLVYFGSVVGMKTNVGPHTFQGLLSSLGNLEALQERSAHEFASFRHHSLKLQTLVNKIECARIHYIP